MKLEPLGDRVVVRREEAAKTSKGGIVLPDTAKEKPRRGEVLAAGPGRWTRDGVVPLTVHTGDTVVFGSYAGTEVDLDGDVVVLLTADEILGVLKR